MAKITASEIESESCEGSVFNMSTVDVATFKAHADELIGKASEATVIEQNGMEGVRP